MTHNQKIQSALASVLTGKAFPSAVQILTSESEEKKDSAVIICTNEMQEEFPQQSGNRYSICGVELRTPEKKSSLATHQALAEALEGFMLADDLGSQMTAAQDDFTVFGILDRQPAEAYEEGYHSYGFTFRLYSCPSDVS